MTEPPRTIIAYARVSTERQGRSGLGLEAQQAAIHAFLRAGDRLLAPIYVEVESGKLGLQRADVEFVAADMPNANRLTIGIMALVAEEEARMISARTKAALASAKARGKKLGRPAGTVVPATRESTQRGAAAAAAARRIAADHHAHFIAPMIEALQAEGASLTEIGRKLSAAGVQTPRGGTGWTATAVRRALLRTGEPLRVPVGQGEAA